MNCQMLLVAMILVANVYLATSNHPPKMLVKLVEKRYADLNSTNGLGSKETSSIKEKPKKKTAMVKKPLKKLFKYGAGLLSFIATSMIALTQVIGLWNKYLETKQSLVSEYTNIKQLFVEPEVKKTASQQPKRPPPKPLKSEAAGAIPSGDNSFWMFVQQNYGMLIILLVLINMIIYMLPKKKGQTSLMNQDQSVPNMLNPTPFLHQFPANLLGSVPKTIKTNQNSGSGNRKRHRKKKKKKLKNSR